MEEKRELPCHEKLAFDNQKTAKAAMVTLDWQKGITLKPYKCRHCGLWHLTSQPS